MKKYRNHQTGEVFESVRAACRAFCQENCYECPMSWENNASKKLCWTLARENPTEAARLMGYEVVEEEPAMEENKKPLSEWTLGEVKAECEMHELCDDCPMVKIHGGDCMINNDAPADWDLTDKPRWTEEELAVLRYIDDCQKIKEVRRAKDGILEILFETEGLWAFPADLFPSLRPGEKVRLSDIVEAGPC